MKIVVIGGTGLIGSKVVSKLTQLDGLGVESIQTGYPRNVRLPSLTIRQL